MKDKTKVTLPHNDDDPSKKTLVSILSILVILIIILICAIIGVSINKQPHSETINNNTENAETKNNDKNRIQNDKEVDCSHATVDLRTLTGENNPNVYDKIYLRTTSRYLCIEDWGIAVKLPDNIYSVIYSPVDNGQADYPFHRVYIRAVIDENNNVNWGGNYMSDSYFSAIASIERAEPEIMSYIKDMYGINSGNILLETDNFSYFTYGTKGEDMAEYYKAIINQDSKISYDNAYITEAPEAFYEDIISVNSFINDKDNYIIYDISKT